MEIVIIMISGNIYYMAMYVMSICPVVTIHVYI